MEEKVIEAMITVINTTKEDISEQNHPTIVAYDLGAMVTLQGVYIELTGEDIKDRVPGINVVEALCRDYIARCEEDE